MSHGVHEQGDLTEVRTVLSGLAGQPVLAVRRSYGDELRIDFGQPVPYASARLAGKTRGEWVLGTRASSWHSTGEFTGATVSQVQVSYPALDLLVTFDNGMVFSVPVNGDDDDLAAWELFTRDGLVVSMGPGRRWNLEPADSPV